MRVKLYNGQVVNVKSKAKDGADFYLLYQSETDEPIDICKGCNLLCKRSLLTGEIDDWLCLLCLIDQNQREDT